MRVTLRAVGLAVAVAAVLGCAKDRYGMKPRFQEEYVEPPPGQARFDKPPTADYRKQAAPKEDKSAVTKTGVPGPGGFGGL